MKISLVVPAYNESKRIIHTLEEATYYMKSHFECYEIIIVDDGSTDDTVAIAETFSNLGVKVLKQPHAGKGKTLKSGILAATGDYIFFTDADLPYALDNIEVAIKHFKDETTALVIGARDLYHAENGIPYPFYRNIMSKAFSFIVNLFLNLDVKDTQCGFKAFKKDTAHTLFPLVEINGFGFDIELLKIARLNHLKIVRIPVKLMHSSGSKVNPFKDSIKMLRDIKTVYKNAKRGLYEIR